MIRSIAFGSCLRVRVVIRELYHAGVVQLRRWRLLLGFLDEYRQADCGERASSLRDEPGLTGDARWDVMLAAVAEHLAYQDDISAPLWVRKPGREWAGSVW